MQSHNISPILVTAKEELPTWFTHRTGGVGLLSNGRFKLVVIGLACMVLGYLMTVSFGPADDLPDLADGINEYETVSPGILEGPSMYGSAGGASYDQRPKKPKAGLDEGPKLDEMEGSGQDGDDRVLEQPSISGALNDLHHAVSDKIESWRPWASRPQGPQNQGSQGKMNVTSRPGVIATKGKNLTETPYVSDELIAPDRDSLGERTRVGKCTIIFGNAPMYERAVRTHEAHDRMHGYPLHVLRQSMLDDVWSKPAYVLSLILRELAKPESERLQWLLWVDADTILLNPYIPVEVFLPPSPEFDDVHIVVSNDWNGLNNGVFPVRVNSWSADLFAAIVSFRYYRPDTPLQFRDQSAMDMLLKEKKFAAHTVYAPQRWFNAYQGEQNETLAPFQVRRGDFLVHFAGVIDREARMRFWLERAEQHLPDWEIEVQHTSYPEEAREFWRQKAAEREGNTARLAEVRKKAAEVLQQMDEKMGSYHDRLSQDDVNNIQNQQSTLRALMEKELTTADIEQVEQTISALDRVAAPLYAALEESRKALMKEAHEAIFSTEKELLENAGATSPEIELVQAKATILKNVVLQPDWKKAQLSTAIEDLRQARGKLQEKLKAAEEEQRKEQEAAAKAEEERKQEEAIANAEEERKQAEAQASKSLEAQQAVQNTLWPDSTPTAA